MLCPFCRNPETQVIDSRAADDGMTIRRRRSCPQCHRRFTTYERVELTMPQVLKRSGARCDYSRAKLRASMELSLRKRPVTVEAIESAIDRIEQAILRLSDKEVASQQIGELVMQELKRLDNVAYIRFASVYRNFEDVGEFTRVIREVEQGGPAGDAP